MWCVCACVCVPCTTALVEVNGQYGRANSLLLPCGSQRLNSGCQGWSQVLLSIQLSFWALLMLPLTYYLVYFTPVMLIWEAKVHSKASKPLRGMRKQTPSTEKVQTVRLALDTPLFASVLQLFFSQHHLIFWLIIWYAVFKTFFHVCKCMVHMWVCVFVCVWVCVYVLACGDSRLKSGVIFSYSSLH